MQVLKSVAKQTSVLNGWILSNAPPPEARASGRSKHEYMNIAILCLFCDTVNMNHDLGRDFLYGFKLCGLIPDRGKKLKKKEKNSWGKKKLVPGRCLRAGFRTPVEGKRDRWAD